MSRLRGLKKIADLRSPHEWFPLARISPRKINYHIGPTNSGKTYSALEHLKKAKTGIYCSPLRLLASEIFEKLNSSGIKCSLITGEEKTIIPGATHMSCTMESINLDESYDCALIDEIQMIGDQDRGSSWTNALLGLWSPEIHLTGDKRPLRLIKNLAKITGDELQTFEYNRLSHLEVCEPVTSIKDLKEGDCIIAFSRKTCHKLKKIIERKDPGSCAIIYGNLPIETRKEQARKFNEEKSVKYLISTDAVGMGLNYNISRVIFFDIKKNDGSGIRKLRPWEVKQISGRAGRFEKNGLVTAWSLEDAKFISQSLIETQLSIERETVNRAGLFPIYSQISEYAEQLTQNSKDIVYHKVLQSFEKSAFIEKFYFFQSIDEVCYNSELLWHLHLDFEDQYVFSHSPLRLTSKYLTRSLGEMAKNLKRKGEVKLIMEFDNTWSLDHLENLHALFELYIWLSKNYEPQVFPNYNDVCYQKKIIAELIEKKLDELPYEDADEIRKAR
ncbi:unnamed protein product [Blepharisma stoltei]|uniref:RNA helicase n=1 Tax=Blepharisma stoltei TaxID=1481888 RepID=A0AAU9J1X9_9CILI|nr:unnamed protein product [Blepharisma stoltei]